MTVTATRQVQEISEKGAPQLQSAWPALNWVLFSRSTGGHLKLQQSYAMLSAQSFFMKRETILFRQQNGPHFWILHHV